VRNRLLKAAGDELPGWEMVEAVIGLMAVLLAAVDIDCEDMEDGMGFGGV
jgi:flagellar motor component MotA